MNKLNNISALDAHIGYWLRLVSNEVSHAFKLKLEQHDISVAEWVILREVLQLGTAMPSQLAQNMRMTRGAISKLIERLFNKALIVRMTDDEDRRYQHITLTPSGEKLIPLLASIADKNDAHFFDFLDEKQRTMLIALMKNIAQHHQIKHIPTE